jgi:hypothetical protein
MRFAFKRSAAKPPETMPAALSVEIGAVRLAVPVRRSDRARRITLRIDTRRGSPVLTLPRRASLAEAERFLANHVGWLESRIGGLPQAVPFVDGGLFPLRGTPTRIVHSLGRGTVTLSDDADGLCVVVHGQKEHLTRRLTDWLKGEARRDLTRAVDRHAKTLGVSPASLRIRDTGSRWGSCSSSRSLSFSWRLVLAPPYVLDYLAAHEVAHLREMNHGPKFWRLVALLDENYQQAETWLKQDGPGLFAVGRDGTV